MQVLVVGPESLLGSSAIVKITSVGRWSVFGDIVEILGQSNGVKSQSDNKGTSNKESCSPCFNQEDTCACSSAKPEPCACESDSCGSNSCNITANNSYPELQNNQDARDNPGLLLRRKPSPAIVEMEDNGNQKPAISNVHDREWGLLDMALLGGIFMSLLTIAALLLYVRY